jgi:hypothetical protein
VGPVDIDRVEFVGPKVGAELRKAGARRSSSRSG